MRLQFSEVFAFAIVLGLSTLAAQSVPLNLGPRADLEIVQDQQGWKLVTTGTNPHFWTSPIPGGASLETHPILSFDYFSTEEIPRVRVRIPTAEGAESLGNFELPLSETWTNYGIDLRLAEASYVAGQTHKFALVWGTREGQEFRIRNLRLRAANAEEQKSAQEREALWKERQEDSEKYLSNLRKTWLLSPEPIRVSKDKLRIVAQLPEGDYSQVGLREIPIHLPSHAEVSEGQILVAPRKWKAGAFEAEILRRFQGRDRSVSRWQFVAVRPDGSREAISAPLYPTEYEAEAQRALPEMQADGIKGLGGIPTLQSGHEIFELGLDHATVNIVLNALISNQPRPGWGAWKFEGRSYFINNRHLQQKDLTIRALSKENVVVSAILLVGNPRDRQGRPGDAMVHPESLASGKFVMPNLATPLGASTYRAIIHFLAERYTRPEAPHGRIANWIIHNEIDQAGTWTNMGRQPLGRYLESYMRSSRIVYQSARSYDPHARVFVSLTHHWSKQSAGSQTYVVRDILNLFSEAAKAEGDFEWGVAYHPYPQSLRNPETWKDDAVAYDFETPYITPKNIEVLPAYLDQPRFHFAGKPRAILLSEQGINAPTLSEKDQKLQAAGIVYTMARVRQLPTVEAFHYHAYRDAPEAEGGLLLGLKNEEYGRKFAWEVYGAIGTEEEAAKSRFAWPILGVTGPEDLSLAKVPRSD